MAVCVSAMPALSWPQQEDHYNSGQNEIHSLSQKEFCYKVVKNSTRFFKVTDEHQDEKC